jgi:hypothetical protein
MADRPEALDRDDIRQIAVREIQAAESIAEQESSDRMRALDMYAGKNLWAAKPGQSTMVDRSLADTVEWLLPQLLTVFTSSDEVVRFDPVGPEDEELASQCTDLCNLIFQRDNNGFKILYDWFKSSLLFRLGVVKVWWEEQPKQRSETFENLTEGQLLLLSQEPGVEISAAETVEGPMGTLYNVTLTWEEPDGKVRIATVAPEEYLFLPSVTCAEDPGQGHRRRVTQSDLIEQGFDADLVDDLPTADNDDSYGERSHRMDSGMLETITRDSRDRASRELIITEWFTKLDLNGDGRTEWVKITLGGINDSVLLDVEEVDGSPFATLTPILMPHKLVGLSISDLVSDLQELKTSITRQMLNSLYLANNPRVWAVADQVNLDELLSAQPGGVVRVRQPGMVGELNTTFVGSNAFPMLEYADRLLETRSGVSKLAQGIDPDVLNGGASQTATGVAALQSAAQQRVSLIARVYAETGVRRLFKLIMQLTSKYQQQARVVRLRGKWVEIDPREFSTDMDLTTEVGLGSGNRMEQMAHLQAILQGQKELLAQGGLGLVSPQELYNTYSKLAALSGLKNADPYFMDPSKKPPEPPQPPPPDPNLEMIRVQAQVEQGKLELAREKMLREDDRERDRLDADMALKAAELQARYGAQINMAAIRAQVDRDREIIKQQAQITQAGMPQQPPQPPGPPQGMPPGMVQ